MSSDQPVRPVVLIVDRREDIRDLYGDWFTSLGFEVMCTGTSNRALTVLERYSADLVVMDLCSSESEGLQAIQQLQSDPLTRSIRVLALTASGDANTLMRARAAGAADAAPKLADFDLLQRRITMLLGRAVGAVLSRHDS